MHLVSQKRAKKLFRLTVISVSLVATQAANAQLICPRVFDPFFGPATPVSGAIANPSQASKLVNGPESQLAMADLQRTPLYSELVSEDLQKPFTKLLTYLQQAKPGYLNPTLFTARLARHRAWLKAGSEPPQLLNSAEDRIAYFTALSEKSGLVDGAVVAANLSSLSSLRNLLFRRNLRYLNQNNGFGAAAVQDIFKKLYLTTHATPISIRRIWKEGLSPTYGALIQAWFEQDIGSRSLVDTIRDLGLLRSPDQLEVMRQTLRHNPAILETVKTIAVASFEIQLFGVPLVNPDGKEIFYKKLSDQLQERAIDVGGGFAPLKNELFSYYGYRPATVVAWHFTSRLIAVCLMAYFLSQNGTLVLQSLLPPDQQGDTQLVPLFLDVTQYWSHVTRSALGLKTKDTKQMVKANADLVEINKELKTVSDPLASIDPDDSSN